MSSSHTAASTPTPVSAERQQQQASGSNTESLPHVHSVIQQQQASGSSTVTYALPSMSTMYNIINTSSLPSNMDVLASASLRDMHMYAQPQQQQQTPSLLQQHTVYNPIINAQLNSSIQAPSTVCPVTVASNFTEILAHAQPPLHSSDLQQNPNRPTPQLQSLPHSIPAMLENFEPNSDDILCKFNNMGSIVRSQLLDRLLTYLTEFELDKLSFSIIQKQNLKSGEKGGWNRMSSSSLGVACGPNSTARVEENSSYLHQLLGVHKDPAITMTPLINIGQQVPMMKLTKTASTQTVQSDQDKAHSLQTVHCRTCQCQSKLLRDKPYVCEDCSKRFSKWRSLKVHMRRHTGEEIFKCKKCNKSFMRSDQFIVHKRWHTNERPYKCAVCNKGFTSNNTLRNHTLLHTGQKPFECRYCHKNFSQRANLASHEKLHTGDAPYQCDLCDKCFIRKDYLADHKKASHSGGEKPFACSICRQQFAWKNALRKHEQQHGETEAYPCDQCGKIFPHKANLRMHLRIHTGIKPHACQFCTKRFMQRQDLKRHEMIHTGVKPHACLYCAKTFIRPRELKNHEKTHTDAIGKDIKMDPASNVELQ